MNSAPPLAKRKDTERFDRLLDTIFPVLNQLHGGEESRRFWAILLHRYFNKFILAQNDRLTPAQIPAMIATDDSVLGSMVEAPGLRQPTRTMPARAVAALGHRLDDLRAPLRALRRHVNRWNWSQEASPECHSLLTGFDYLHVITRLVPQPTAVIRSRSIADVPRALAKRHLLQEMATDLDCPDVQLAVAWLPWWYVEGFAGIMKGVDQDAGRMDYHASYLSDISVRMQVARGVSRGAQLTMYQHSAGYGEVEGHVMYHAESTFADEFRTWGWALGPRDRPFIGLRLLKPTTDAYPAGTPKGDWVYALIREHRNQYAPVTLELQRRFFTTLQSRHLARVVVRTRTKRGGSARLQVWPSIRDRVKHIDDGSCRMATVLATAEVVILDSFPSSIFMECASAGMPVLAIVPGIRFTSVAQRFYPEFGELGLLHPTPEAAADFLNSTDIPLWWRAVEKTEIFQNFLRTFCNRDPAAVTQ